MMMQCDVSLRGSQYRVRMGKIPWYVYMSSLPCSSVCLTTRCGCAKSELSQVGPLGDFTPHAVAYGSTRLAGNEGRLPCDSAASMEDLDDVQCAPVAFARSGGITHLISRRATSCPYMGEAQRVAAVPKHQTAPLSACKLFSDSRTTADSCTRDNRSTTAPIPRNRCARTCLAADCSSWIAHCFRLLCCSSTSTASAYRPQSPPLHLVSPLFSI
jgi:hypothetical protein